MPGHEHARRRVARLAGVVEHHEGAARDRFFERCVVAQNIRRLAAEFLRHTLHRRRRVLSDEHTGPRRARERDHGNTGMPGYRGTHARPVTVDEIEDAGWHPGGIEYFCKYHRVEWCYLARFENHRATGCQRRGDLDGNLVHRPVPGCDEAADSDRFAAHAGRANALLELVILQGPEGSLDVLRSAKRLGAPRQ